MATVYHAVQEGPHGFENEVALKLLHEELVESQPHVVQMLVDEARAVARVRHANVVRILDLCDEGRNVYLVMDWVDGLSMREVLDRCRDSGERPPVRPILQILIAACEGLHAAHRVKRPDGTTLGIVHRDVKPGNILVGHNEEVKVADFGVARFEDRFVESTALGQMKGTPAYMAPEQVLGQEVDHRTDIFSMGVTLYTLLTGKLAFTAETPVAVALKLVRESMEPHAKELEGIHPGLGPILARACAPLREGRFTSAQEVAASLRAVMATTPAAMSIRELIEWAGWKPWAGEGTTDEVSLAEFDSRLRRFGGVTVDDASPGGGPSIVSSATRAWQGETDEASLLSALSGSDLGGASDSEEVATDPHVRAASADHSAVLSTHPVDDDSLQGLDQLDPGDVNTAPQSAISAEIGVGSDPANRAVTSPVVEVLVEPLPGAPRNEFSVTAPSPAGPQGPAADSRRPPLPSVPPRPPSRPAAVLPEFAATVPIRTPSRPAAPMPQPPLPFEHGHTTTEGDGFDERLGDDPVGVTPTAEILPADEAHVASLRRSASEPDMPRLRPPSHTPPPLAADLGAAPRPKSTGNQAPVSGPVPISGPGPAPTPPSGATVPGPLPRGGPRGPGPTDSGRLGAVAPPPARKAQPELDYRGRVVKGTKVDAPPGGLEKVLVVAILLLLFMLLGVLVLMPSDDEEGEEPAAAAADSPGSQAPPDLPVPSPPPPQATPSETPGSQDHVGPPTQAPPASTPVSAPTATPGPQNPPPAPAAGAIPARTPDASPRPQPAAAVPTGGTSTAGPASTAAGLGRLTVNSYPWSQVFVDGREVGRTPIQLLELPAGQHEVRLRFEDASLAEVVELITVSAGQEARLVKRMAPAATPAP